MVETTTSKRISSFLRIALVVVLALSAMAFYGCSAQTAGSESSSSASAATEESNDGVLEEDSDAKSGTTAGDEVDRASIVTGEGVGGTAPASSEQVALAQSVAAQLGVPIQEGISFSMGPLLLDESQGDVPLRAMIFYEGPNACASGLCTEDGTLYGDLSAFYPTWLAL